jgi:signal peptide peptidase SppA
MTMHFLAACLTTPWALEPERMAAYARILAHRYAVGRARADVEDEMTPGRSAAEAAAARRAGARSGAIAVIPVVGTVMQRASAWDCGGATTQAISQQLREANADDSVSSILLDIDSPGGSVYGVAELAAEIRASGKPVTAIANSLAASAAYWIGTAAKEFFVTPGGEVGSIGVWMAHEDWSKALEAEGVNVTLISAGKFKTEGNPYGPLPDDAKAFMQSRTDDYYGAFTRDVAKGRGLSVDQVRGGMGQGRVLGASQAVTEKMVDGVMTFDQVVRRMQQSARPSGKSAALAAQERRLALAELEG